MIEGDVHASDLLGRPEGDAEPRRPAKGEVKSGVQPDRFLRAFIGSVITAETPITDEQIQPASIDLRLGSVAYRVRASFLPDPRSEVLDKVLNRMDGHEVDLSAGAVLDRGQVYLIPLQESLCLPSSIRGLANPKSSTGRLDVLVRLITEKGVAFDEIRSGYNGKLYVEVAPQTFSVVVRPGTRLNQIRLLRGNGNAVLTGQPLKVRYRAGELVSNPSGSLAAHDSLMPVAIDLKGDDPNSPVGFRAKRYTDRIDLDRKQHYECEDYWEPIYPGKGTLILDPGEFYILVTREYVRVPPDLAAEMVAYETRSGEYRVHYAGFFDPGFGHDPTGQGSRAVLEVRSQIPFMLEHGQTVGWLRYEKMADTPERVYGAGVGSHYQGQGLALAKQFKPFVRRS